MIVGPAEKYSALNKTRFGNLTFLSYRFRYLARCYRAKKESQLRAFGESHLQVNEFTYFVSLMQTCKQLVDDITAHPGIFMTPRKK
jgi:hypothetical protein